MPRTSPEHLAKLPEIIFSLHEATTLDALGPACLRTMRTLLDADVYTVDAIAHPKLHCISLTWPKVIPDANMDMLNAHLAQHPSLCAVREPNKWPTVMWTDTTTLRQFRRTALYHDFFRPTGMSHQIATSFALDDATTFHAVFNRRRRDYTAEDRGVLEIILPHFRQAYAQAIARANFDHALAVRDLVAAETAALLVTADGSVHFATESARRLCRDYFGEEIASHAPTALRRGLDARRADERRLVHRAEKGELLVECDGPVNLPPAVSLIHESPGQAGYGWLLRFEERAASGQVFRQLGLTAREAEVLHWMAQGKRDLEMAKILEAMPRTIGKHVEHIFAKLGVETRTGAVAAAWDFLSRGK